VILYLDTSVFLKQYLEEPGADRVETLVKAADTTATSLITYAEGRSGLARAVRGARLDAAGYETARHAFEQDWGGFLVREVDASTVRFAGSLAEKHFLRGLDAIQLASALSLQEALDEPVTFLASDGRLMSAAAAEGLSIPQSTSPAALDP
jgi:hypothetical protein